MNEETPLCLTKKKTLGIICFVFQHNVASHWSNYKLYTAKNKTNNGNRFLLKVQNRFGMCSGVRRLNVVTQNALG